MGKDVIDALDVMGLHVDIEDHHAEDIAPYVEAERAVRHYIRNTSFKKLQIGKVCDRALEEGACQEYLISALKTIQAINATKDNRR